MCITDFASAMRPHAVDLLPVNFLSCTNTHIARLPVVPVDLRGAEVTFMLSEAADPSSRALFSREEGQLEMKYLSFTILALERV